MYVQWYKFENAEVERMLFRNCAVVCFILEYVYIGQMAKSRTSQLAKQNQTLYM